MAKKKPDRVCKRCVPLVRRVIRETIELSRMERERESPVISSAVHSANFYNVRERSDLWAMRPSAAQKTWGRKKHEL